MDKPTAPQLQLGSVLLYQAAGKLMAKHKAMAQPVVIDPKQIERFIVKQLRQLVV